MHTYIKYSVVAVDERFVNVELAIADELLDDKVITSHMSKERQKYKELIFIF